MTARNSLPWYLLAGLIFTAFNMAHLVAWRFGTYVHMGIYVLLLLAIVALTSKSRRLNVLLISLTLVFFALLILQYPVTEWDARSIWFFHGKRIYYDQDLYAQLDNYPTWTHKDYPTLVPAMAASVAASLGHWNEILPRISIVACFTPVLFFAAYVLRSFGFLCLWIAAMLWTCNSELLTGYMDSPLAAYFAISCVLIAKLFEATYSTDLDRPRDQIRNLWLGVGACLVHMLLLKNEGAILSALVLTMLLPVLFKQIRFAWIPAMAIVFYVVMWWYPVFEANITNDLVKNGGILDRGISRIQSQGDLDLIFGALRHHTSFFHFAFLALIPAVLLKWHRFKYIIPALMAPVLYMGVIFVVYLTTYQNLEWHLNTSANRVVLPFNLATLTLWIFIVHLALTRDADEKDPHELENRALATTH